MVYIFITFHIFGGDGSVSLCLPSLHLRYLVDDTAPGHWSVGVNFDGGITWEREGSPNRTRS